MPISPRASPIGLPALRASSTRELLVALVERRRRARCSSRGAVARRDRAPGREGGLGARDRRVDVVGGRALDLGQDLLGGRLDDLQGHRVPA